MESLEKEYVLVDPHFASLDTFSYHLETSLPDYSTSRFSKCQPNKSDQELAVSLKTKDTAGIALSSAEIPKFQGSDPPATSSEPTMLKEVQRLSILHPSTRLQFLRRYAQAIAELAQEKVIFCLLFSAE